MKLYVIGEDKRRKECITLLLQKTTEETEKKKYCFIYKDKNLEKSLYPTTYTLLLSVLFG